MICPQTPLPVTQPRNWRTFHWKLDRTTDCVARATPPQDGDAKPRWRGTPQRWMLPVFLLFGVSWRPNKCGPPPGWTKNRYNPLSTLCWWSLSLLYSFLVFLFLCVCVSGRDFGTVPDTEGEERPRHGQGTIERRRGPKRERQRSRFCLFLVARLVLSCSFLMSFVRVPCASSCSCSRSCSFSSFRSIASLPSFYPAGFDR